MADSQNNCLQGKFLLKSEAFFVSQINTSNLTDCLTIEQSAEKTRSIRSEEGLLSLLNNYTCYGLFENKQMLGFAFFAIMPDEAELLDINILKSLQGKGLGTAFLQQCQTIINKDIILEVAVDNFQAIKAYQKFSYQQIGIRKNYYQNIDGSKTDALVYRITQ